MKKVTDDKPLGLRPFDSSATVGGGFAQGVVSEQSESNHVESKYT